MSSQENIRAKRLAKLAVQNQSSSSTSSPTSKPTPAQPVPQKIVTETNVSKESTDDLINHDTTVPAKRKSHSPFPKKESLESWITKEVEDILQLTLNSDHPNTRLQFLEATFRELVEENQDPVFTKELLDRAIIERLSEIGVTNPFRYLKDAWISTKQSKRLLKQKDPQRETKLEILNELERLTSSYGLVAFQIPDMFLNGSAESFVKDIISHENSYSEFLTEIINISDEEGTILEFLNIFIPTLSHLILSIDLNNPQYPLILNIFQSLLNEKSVAAVFTQVEGFKIPSGLNEPAKFETVTILGPIFKLSSLQDSVALNNFDRSTVKTKHQINQIGKSLQSEHKVLLDRLFFIANRIIRGSETSRKDLLQYFATIINKNHLRRGDHADFSKLSSNAFIANISIILIRLSQPFLDQSFNKIDRIDINYFSKSSLIDINEETKINSTNAEASKYFESTKSDEATNFISDCFYLTLAYLHYGIGGVALAENKTKQRIKQSENTLKTLRERSTNNPMQRLLEFQIPRIEKSLADMKSIQDALVSFFTHRDIQLEIFDFIAGASTFLIRVVDPGHNYPQKQIKIPLIPDIIGVENVDNTDYFREKAAVPFKYYPEFLVEGIINYCHYISKFVANPMLLNPRLKSFVEFAVVFLRCPELIGNPHLKGRLVEVLFLGSLPTQDGHPGFMMEIFETDELVSNSILYALLDFYVVVEKTGSSSQFYDKFNSRYHISSILEQLWKNPLFRNQLSYQSEHNEEFFIRFIARMLNDLTFMLDEALHQLAEVHSIQNELDARANNQRETLEGTVEELRSRLSSAESQAKSYVGLANKSIDLFGLFTEEVPRAFVKSEIVGRLASMLDYNLDAIAGPKCSELKVRDPEKYSFKPKELLVNISKIFVNLSEEPEFINAVSQDSRSFKISTFKRAEDVLGKFHLVSNEFIAKLHQFAHNCESKKLEEEEEETELGEIPDEFLDPLMYTLMKDPVTLPGSKVNIDRSTIRMHLLSDSTDPFNRMPLKLEDVIPNEELKKQIDEFKSKGKHLKDVEMTDV